MMDWGGVGDPVLPNTFVVHFLFLLRGVPGVAARAVQVHMCVTEYGAGSAAQPLLWRVR